MLLYVKTQISHCGLGADLIPIFLSFHSPPSWIESSHNVLWVLMLMQFTPPPTCQALKLAASWAWNTLRPGILGSSFFKFQLKFCLLRETLPSHLKETSFPFLPSSLLPISVYFLHKLYHNLKLSLSLIYFFTLCLSLLECKSISLGTWSNYLLYPQQLEQWYMGYLVKICSMKK